MSSRFPELGVDRTHCKEMNWLQSVANIFLGDGATVEDFVSFCSFGYQRQKQKEENPGGEELAGSHRQMLAVWPLSADLVVSFVMLVLEQI
jgi:hypothetical protein